MKIFLATLGALVSFSATAQQDNSFVLKGKLQNAANAKLILQNRGTTTFMDSTTTDSEGNFVLRGKIKEPDVYIFGLKGTTNYVQFQMENSAITITGDASDMRHVQISGSKDQALLTAFDAKMAPLDQQMTELEKTYADASAKKDSVTMKAITESRMPAWKASRSALMTDFVRLHPASAVSVGVVADYVSGKYGTIEKADQLMRLVEATPVGKYTRSIRIRNVINGQMAAQSGRMAPNFSQPDTAGHLFSLSGLKGKYILVDFWASWCHPCRAENPNVLKAYHTFKDKNFTVVAISLDVNKNAWLKAIQEDHLPWLQLSDLQKDNSAAKQYGVVAIPSNFLVDPSGKVIATELRGEGLDRKLHELFGN